MTRSLRLLLLLDDAQALALASLSQQLESHAANVETIFHNNLRQAQLQMSPRALTRLLARGE